MKQIIVTAEELVDFFDCERSQITRLQNAGVISRLPGVAATYDLRTCVRSYVKHQREAAAGRSGDHSVKEASLIESTLLKQVNRQIAELKLEAGRLNLINKDEVIALWVKKAAVFKTAVLGLPARLKLSRQDTKRAVKVCDDVLNEVAEEAIDGL